MYTLIYLRVGSLPWSPDAGDIVNLFEMGRRKRDTDIEEICAGCPVEFQTFLEYVKRLGFYDKPNYAYLRNLLQTRFKRAGYQHDNVFDWTEKLYRDTYGGPVANAGNEAQGGNEANEDGEAQEDA